MVGIAAADRGSQTHHPRPGFLDPTPICAALVSLSIGFGLVTAEWLFISPGAISIGVALSRIPREERMMREGVPGYADYTAKGPFRLLPGIS